MSKRRVTIKAKSQHIAYLEISPSKRRDVRKRSLPMSIQEVFHNEPKKNHSAMDDFSGEDDTTCNDMFTDSTRSSTYSRREEKAAANWSEVREQLLNASVETSIPISSALCIVCDHPADTVCLDCGAHAYYCSEHVENVHSKTNIFHRPRLWKEGMLLPYVFKVPRSFSGNHVCETAYIKDVVCVDQKGFQHNVCVTFCKCESEAASLVRNHMWPATPKSPSLAFHFDLLLWIESLLLEGSIGADAFCRALDFKVGREVNQQFRKIYPAIIDVFEEFRFRQYLLDNLQFISPQLNTITTCPACPKMEGTHIISMDAMFGLCRKKSAGESHRPPLFSGVFFEDQEGVDQFVESYDSADKIMDKGCHEFLAGDTLRSKQRYTALDETAVFGSICRHEYPQRFFSMKHGERLAYPVYLLEKIKQTEGNKNTLLLYDIACVFETHLKNRGRIDLLDKTVFGVPIFHVYGHCAFCQLTYSPRVLTGCGLTDGEATERLWSYLRRFSKTTKEMRPSHRIDVLTSCLLHYASKVRQKVGTSLIRRLTYAKDIECSAVDDLNKLISNSEGALTESQVKDIESTLLPSMTHVAPSFSQRHKTFQCILNIARERKFLIATKARYADGQSIATRLAKKISSATSTLKRAVSKYNSMPPDSMEGNMYHLPRELNWENISNFEQLTSLEVSTLVCNTTFIPIDTQIKVMRALNMKQRAIEEQKMIKNEMATVVYSYKHEHSLLKKYIQDSVQSQATLTQFQRGCLSLLYNRLLFCESFLINLSNAFSVYHDVVLPEFILLGPNGMLCTSVTTLNHQTCESLVDVQCCNSDTESDSDSQSDVDHDSL